MAILKILTYPNPLLRKACEEVDTITPEIRTLLDDMAETMYSAPGIGLAASQIGSPHRVIVVDIGPDEETGRTGKLLKLVNPEIVSQEGSLTMEEGCLSIPEIREKVTRSAHVVVQALNEAGEEVEIEANDLLAVCLQHEIDHLNGVLFIDHLSRIKQHLVMSKLKKLLAKE